MNQHKTNNRISLPMEVLQDIEEALNFPPFFGIPVGATLNDVLVVALSNASHVWGWRPRVRDVLRTIFQRYRRAVSSPVDLAPYSGRMLFTWLHARADLKEFVVPLLNNYDRDDYVVLGPEHNMQEQLPGSPDFLTWDEFPSICMTTWRREFARCRPAWSARLNDVLRKHEVPSYVGTFLMSHLQTQSQFLMACEGFLDQVKPTVIVTEYDRNLQASCLVLAAKKRGIPAVTMVHASAMPFPSYGWAPLLASQVCCWGEVHREKFKLYGVGDDRIAVTGCQATPVALNSDRDAARRRVGVALECSVVLLATSPIRLDERLAYTGVFCEAISGMPGVSALVRLHPAEHLADYQEIIHRFPMVKFMTNADMSRDEALVSADLIVSHESSFGIDALLKGKLVIVLDLPSLSGSVKIVRELIDDAGCPGASDTPTLRAAAGRVLTDSAWRTTLSARAAQYGARHCASFGPDAAANVCQVIDRLAAGRGRAPSKRIRS